MLEPHYVALWRAAVVANLNAGEETEQAIDSADLVVGHYRSRFDPTYTAGQPMGEALRTAMQFRGLPTGLKVIFMDSSGIWPIGTVKDFEAAGGKQAVDKVLVAWDDEYVDKDEEPEDWVSIDQCRVYIVPKPELEKE